MNMLCWLAVALSLGIIGAIDEPTSCVGETSLLQKQQHRAVHMFDPNFLTERATSAAAANLTEGQLATLAANVTEGALAAVAQPVEEEEGEEEHGEGAEEGGGAEEEMEGAEKEEEEGAFAEPSALGPGNQTEYVAGGAPAAPAAVAAVNLVEDMFDPTSLTEGATSAAAAHLTEGQRAILVAKVTELTLAALTQPVEEEEGEEEDGEGEEEGGEEEGMEGAEKEEEEEGAPAKPKALAPGNQTEYLARGAPAAPAVVAAVNLVEGAPVSPGVKRASPAPAALAPGNLLQAASAAPAIEAELAAPTALAPGNLTEGAPAAPAAPAALFPGNLIEGTPAAPTALAPGNFVTGKPASPAINGAPAATRALAPVSLIEGVAAVHAANLVVEEALAAPAAYEAIPDEVLEKLIISTPWNCELLPQGFIDPRAPTCGLHFNETGLHPAHLSALGNSSHDHMNSMRMLFPIGVLPCCSTMPFCAAPACSAIGARAATPAQTCTKSLPKNNFGYMSSAQMWPAFHGWGGSYEMDVTKHVDVIGTLLRQDGRAEPVDIVIDIGANSGFISEKLTTRHFAKDYILVEAYKGMLQMFESRLGNATFKQRWFAEQVPARPGTVIPKFEFLNVAVSNRSGGVLDLCVADSNMWGAVNKGASCPVDKVALDEVIPGRLSQAFRSAFAEAKSAYVKVDVEGYDQMALEGMAGILREERGVYSNGAQRHLINFIQLEVCVVCTESVKKVENRTAYDVKTVTAFLESMGFESFLMGPRYLPLSHGSWDDSFNEFFLNPENTNVQAYPAFHHIHCPGPSCDQRPPANTFTADLFAMRATHPRATEIKVALGACEESKDFTLSDEQYALPPNSVPA